MFTPSRSFCVALRNLVSGILCRFVETLLRGVRDCPEMRLEAEGGQSRCASMQPGAAASDITLRRIGGGACSLSDYCGRRVLLVFIRAGCQRCHDIASELNRVQRFGEMQVLAISLDSPRETALWADDVLAAFPVLVDSGHEIAVEYDVPDAPFGFVIDVEGRIAASGAIARRSRTDFTFRPSRPDTKPSNSFVPAT